VVAIVVAAAAALYVAYLIRTPIAWVVIAVFIAVALSGPVALLTRRMRRGLAIAVVYLGVTLLPFLLLALLIPPVVTQADNLARELPGYAADLQQLVASNETLRGLNADFDISGRIEEEARKLPARLGDAAQTLGNLGIGVVNSVFALVTILILSILLVKDGPGWVRRAIDLQPADRADRLRRAANNMNRAVGNYVGGALAQATVAGLVAFVVLLILGIPYAGPLAVLIALFDLVPLVGATIGAVLVGIVTLFVGFPGKTIAWAVFAIVYQQFENNVIQPQIQRRAVQVHPFAVLVSVLVGSTLFGVIGALVAIPVAASMLIALREYSAYRRGAAPPDHVAEPAS
jgi:predicted PurR-regulated permease PerM